MKEWIIRLKPDGSLEIRGEGFTGDQCESDALQEILDQEATDIKRERNDDYYKIRQVENPASVRNTP